MNECSQYIGLISAYADGELTDSDKEYVEEHLGACVNCSALLELYRAISAAESGSCVPAPEELRAGVMEKVLSDDAPGVSDDVKKRARRHIILTRYLPVAACLAIVLLALPFIRNLNRGSNAPLPGSAPQLQPAAQNGAGSVAESQLDLRDSGAAERGFDESAASVSPGAAPSGMPSPSSAPLLPSSAPHSPENEAAPSPPNPSLDTSGTGGYNTATGNGETTESPAGAPDYGAAHGPVLAPGASSAPAANEAPQPGAPPAEKSRNGQDLYGKPPEIFAEVPDYFNDAYAWISITGDLPPVMLDYDPVLIEGWGDWDTWYAIPRETARSLIGEMGNLDGFAYVYKNEESDTAFVFYRSLE